MQYVQYWTMFRVQGENIRTALKGALLNNILTNIDIPFRNMRFWRDSKIVFDMYF